jgi:hypothetical protein
MDWFVAALLAMTGRIWVAALLQKNRHTPPPGLASGEPDDRLQRSIQYAAPPRFHHWRLGILDRPLEPVIGRPFGRPVGGRCKFRSCPGRGAAFFTLLRRAGTQIDSSTMDPGSAAHRCALRCVRGTLWAPPEVCQTCLMKGNAERPHFARVPDAVQRPSRCCAEPGPIVTVAGWTPALQRTAARCAASGARCGTAGGLSDVSDEGKCGETTFRSCPGRGAAPFALLRRAGTHSDGSTVDPGSAAHRCALRCVRGTLWHRWRFIRRV